MSPLAPQPASRHVQALDGMRGVAVLAVVCFHAGYFDAGWAGVQMFFVLSGFLITSILVAEKDYPFAFYLKRFYWRRALRIFPLYFAFIGAIVIAALLMEPWPAFRQQWLYLLTYTFNYTRFLPDYIVQPYWGHLWSLSVEEQFYLLWPALIYFLPRRALGWVLIGLLVATPLLRLAIEIALPERTLGRSAGFLIYHLTICQLDAFAAGALVAYTRAAGRVRKPVHLWLLASVVALGVGMINQLTIRDAMSILTVGYPWTFPFHYQSSWGYAILNLWSATLIRALLHPNWLTTFFRWGPLVYVGRISYGAYVFHLPSLVVARKLLHLPIGSRSLGGLFGFALYLAVTLAVSHASYAAFECRFLALKNRRFVTPPAGDLEARPTAAAGL